MTTVEHNKAIVQDFIDALFSRGELSAVGRFLSDDFINHDPPVGVRADREGMRSAAEMFRVAFPDWHSVVHQLIAQDDMVVEHFTASGTHEGQLLGAAPTGSVVSLSGINIFRLRGDTISERWGCLDELGLLRQLGLLPLAGAAASQA